MENLLSKHDKEALKNGYKKRLVIMWCWLLVLALPIFFILAAPVYIAAGLKLSEIVDRNKVNESANADNSTVLSLPELIDKKSDIVMAYMKIRESHSLIVSVIGSAPAGVSIEEVIFERSKTKKPDELKVSGIAKDREALSNYQQALKDLPQVSNAVVPVESFSRPTNLSFLVNIVLASTTPKQ